MLMVWSAFFYTAWSDKSDEEKGCQTNCEKGGDGVWGTQ